MSESLKILITGADGFIGKNLKKYLMSKGHGIADYDYIENVVPDCSQFDKVIHMGAISSTTERDIEKVLQQNLDFSHRLLQVCDMQGIDLIYASSASVYGDGQMFNEDAPKQPQSPYSWSKYLFDRSVQMLGWEDYKCNVKGLRFFNVYGEHEEHKGDQMSVFHKFTNQAKETGKVHPFEGSDEYLRDFVYVGDVCKIIEKMLTIDEMGIWNVGMGETTSFGSIADAIAEKYNAKVEPIPMPKALQGQYQKYTCSDNTKLLKTIGNFKFTTPQEWIQNATTR
jgi:ADP-L-glycero-D-manno-heptose 6-epimerase